MFVFLGVGSSSASSEIPFLMFGLFFIPADGHGRKRRHRDSLSAFCVPSSLLC